MLKRLRGDKTTAPQLLLQAVVENESVADRKRVRRTPVKRKASAGAKAAGKRERKSGAAAAAAATGSGGGGGADDGSDSESGGADLKTAIDASIRSQRRASSQLSVACDLTADDDEVVWREKPKKKPKISEAEAAAAVQVD